MKKAFFILTLSTFSGAALTFATQVFLARVLPQSEFGEFFAALSLVTLIAPLGGFGAGAFMLKVFGEEGWAAIRWLRPLLNFTIFSCFIALLIICNWALLFEDSQLNSRILYFLSLIIIAQVTLEHSSAIFQIEGKYEKLAMLQFLPHAMRFLLIFLVWLACRDEINALMTAGIYSLTAIITIAIGWTVTKRATQGNIALIGHTQYNKSSVYRSIPSAINTFKQSWPFGLAGISHLIYFQSNIVIVQYMLGNELAGQYSIAMTIMTAVYLFPGIIYQKILLVKIHIWANHDKEKLITAYRFGNAVMLATGITISLTLMIIAPHIISFLFGDTFSTTIKILGILALSVPLRFVASNVGSVLVTKNNIKKKVHCMSVVAIMNIGMNIIFTSEYGVVGTAYSSVLTEAFLVCAYLWAAKKFVFSKSNDLC